MGHIKDELLRTVCVLRHIAVFLLLAHFIGGQSQETSPPRPVVAMVGDDVILPCHLEPPMDAVWMTMEWGRPDLDPRFVHVWHEGKELLSDQNKAYKGRASLSVSKLKIGDISLTLSKVRISDNGIYRCYIPKLSREYFVELLVGAVSSPHISLAGIHTVSGGVMLDCESAGWYPEPEVLWLDSEGHVLSAGPTETVRGPDDLYTVSSRVTVDKRHSNSFTCRVQQNHINQTRETQIQVPDDFFMTGSSCTAPTVISVLFGLLFALTVVFFVWKWRQNKMGIKMRLKSNNEARDGEKTAGPDVTTEQPLIKAKVSREQLMAEITKLKSELQNKEDMTQTLRQLKTEMEKQKEKLTEQMGKAERQAKENEDRVNLIEREITERKDDKTAVKAQGYSKLKVIIKENSWNLEERKKELQELQMNTEKLLKRTIDHYNRITGHQEKERKDEVQSNSGKVQGQQQDSETDRGHSEGTSVTERSEETQKTQTNPPT